MADTVDATTSLPWSFLFLCVSGVHIPVGRYLFMISPVGIYCTFLVDNDPECWAEGYGFEWYPREPVVW